MPVPLSASSRELRIPEELAEVCAQYQMPAMALLDRDGVYGAARFHLAAQKAKIKAHIGAEVSSLLGYTLDDLAIPRLPLLCISRKGYQNLCQLITRTKLRAPKYPKPIPQRRSRSRGRSGNFNCARSRFFGDLAEYAVGLTCLTGGDEGPLAHALAKGGMEAGRELLEQLVTIYGHNNVYVELQRHYNRAQEVRNQAAIELARSLHLPLLATQGAQYARREERQILDVFTCIRNHRTLDTAGRLLAHNSERYLKTPQEMQQLFADLPEATANTLELSSRLEFTLNDLGYEFPRYPVGPGENHGHGFAGTHPDGRARPLFPGGTKRTLAARKEAD